MHLFTMHKRLVKLFSRQQVCKRSTLTPETDAELQTSPLRNNKSQRHNTKSYDHYYNHHVSIVVVFSILSFVSCVDCYDKSAAAFNYLMFDARFPATGKMASVLANTSHYHASDTIDLELANSAWRQLRSNALEYAKLRVELARPLVTNLMSKAEVSVECRSALTTTLDSLAKLEQWAVQMYNSFGDFPSTGVFEGTLNSMGSFHQCVGAAAPEQTVGRAQYCSFQMQPLLPKRPIYHNILSEIDGLANFTEKNDFFRHVAHKAQYMYYTRWRMAACLPTKCTKTDLESIVKQIAIGTYVQFAGISCIEAKEFSPDGAQWFAIIVLVSLASLSGLGTLIQLSNIKRFFVVRNHELRVSSSSRPRSPSNGKLQVRNVTQHEELSQQQENSEQTTRISEDLNETKTSLLLAPNGTSRANTRDVDKITQQANHQQQHRKHNSGHLFQGGQIMLKPTSNSEFVQVVSQSNSQHHSQTIASTSPPVHRQNLIAVLDFLSNFSVVKNARRLFDTTSSGSRSKSAGKDKDSAQGSKDISCVHGLRFWTISWIIFGHTMQYTEWAAFGRAYQVEENITSFWLHPLLNATFSVDTFFLISGLLTTYVSWSISGGQYRRFNKFAFLVSRYLRLTPQVLIVVLFFIIYPLMGDGPYWRGLIQTHSDHCKNNWWVNALYLQSFIRKDQICNLVTWWLSIEMFYHFVSLAVIVALLKSTRRGLITAIVMGSLLTSYSCILHYSNAYPPNMLPTLLQRYEVWDSIVLKYFWTPYPHAPAYFVGLLLGYLLYERHLVKLSTPQVRLGWVLATVSYLVILFGTYGWNKNAPYSRITSTLYYNGSQVFWALSTGWTILACALGHGGCLNSFLSSPVFIPLGRSTYMTYLSHMLIVMAYPAKMNLLIEPSYIVFLYIFISNLVLSYMLGITLTIVYESPILGLQKLLISSMATAINPKDAIPTNNVHAQPEDLEGLKMKINPYMNNVMNNNNDSNIINNNNNNIAREEDLEKMAR